MQQKETSEIIIHSGGIFWKVGEKDSRLDSRELQVEADKIQKNPIIC